MITHSSIWLTSPLRCVDCLNQRGVLFTERQTLNPAGGLGGAVSPPAGSGTAPRKKLIFYHFYVLKKLDFEYFGRNSGKQYSLQQLIFSPANFAPSFIAMPQTLSLHAYVKIGEGHIRQHQTWTSGRSIRPFPRSPPQFLRLQVLTTKICDRIWENVSSYAKAISKYARVKVH